MEADDYLTIAIGTRFVLGSLLNNLPAAVLWMSSDPASIRFRINQVENSFFSLLLDYFVRFRFSFFRTCDRMPEKNWYFLTSSRWPKKCIGFEPFCLLAETSCGCNSVQVGSPHLPYDIDHPLIIFLWRLSRLNRCSNADLAALKRLKSYFIPVPTNQTWPGTPITANLFTRYYQSNILYNESLILNWKTM